jgi:shikimate kinase
MSELPVPAGSGTSQEAEILAALGQRLIVLVGMMGAGKSTVGRRLAARLRLPFLDADIEIEAAAGMSIPEIFESHGEAYFRDGEARVIVPARGDPPQGRRQGRIDLAQGGFRHHPAPRQATGRPSATADLRSRRDHRPPDRRTRTGLSACRHHHLVARRAARQDRRRVCRGPLRQGAR